MGHSLNWCACYQRVTVPGPRKAEGVRSGGARRSVRPDFKSRGYVRCPVRRRVRLSEPTPSGIVAISVRRKVSRHL
jgi:hypothetical protein